MGRKFVSQTGIIVIIGEIPMIKDTISQLSVFDPEIGAAVEAEYHRQRRGIELIASENVVSEAVLLAAGTILNTGSFPLNAARLRAVNPL